MTKRMTDMDGTIMRISDRVVCLTFPDRERCLSRIVGFRDDGQVVVDNGRSRRAVDPESCIVQRAR